MQNGAVRAGAKRAVFADVSNTTRTAPVTEDNVKAHDNPKATTVCLQEPAGLLKPAQKPLAVKNITTTTVPTKSSSILPATRKVQAKKSASVLRESEVASANTTSTDETEPCSEATSDDTEEQEEEEAATFDEVEADQFGPAGPVQAPQTLAHPEAVIVDTNGLVQFAPESDEKVVVLSQSLITINDDEYDEEEEEEFIDGAQTVARGGATDNTTGGATVVLCPRYTSKALKEIEEAKKVVESTRTAEDIEDDQWDTSMVAEYGDEIFEYMRTLEVSRQHAPA